VAVDRRVLNASAVTLVYAAAIWSASRLWDDVPSLLLIAATAGLVVSLMLVLGRPFGSIAALMVATALNRYSAEIAGATIKPEHVAAPLVALALLPDLPRLVRRLDPASWLLLIWLAWSVVGSINAPDPGNSVRLWFMLLLVAFSYFAMVTLIDATDALERATVGWLAVGIVVALYGLVEHLLFLAGVDLGIQVNPVTHDPMVPGTFYEANLFGSAMMMLGLTGIALLAFHTAHRLVAFAAALVGLLAIQVSLTRTAWIALAGGLVLLVLVWMLVAWRGDRESLRYSGAPARVFLLLAACVVSGTLVLWLPESAERETIAATDAPTPVVVTPAPTLAPLVVGTPQVGVAASTPVPDADIGRRVTSVADSNDASIRIRIEFARRAIREWREHPVVGLGIGSFGQRYITTSNDRAWISNVGVRLLHDGGLVGLGLFIAAMLLLARRYVRLIVHPRGSESERIALALGVAVAAMFAAFQATEGLQIGWYWLSLGLFAAAVRVAGESTVGSSERA
jgi:hypothetical protein